MGKITVNPYLFFDGNCREAMEFYQQVFGGELQIKTFGETDDSCAEAMKDKIMHAHLSGGELNLLASDGLDSGEVGKRNISLALGGDDDGKLRKIFVDLSEGGKIIHPLEKQFWGDTFGDLTDKFNVGWMVNISSE